MAKSTFLGGFIKTTTVVKKDEKLPSIANNSWYGIHELKSGVVGDLKVLIVFVHCQK